jgi:hypothetical protein
MKGKRSCGGCEKGAPFDGAWQPHQCRLCWLFHNNSGYRRLWAGEEPVPPTMTEKIKNFSAAMTEETRWRLSGGRGLTEDEVAKRRSLCDACEHRDTDDDSCKICGCYLSQRALPPVPVGKLNCATQSCPKGFWSHVAEYRPKTNCGKCQKKAEHAITGRPPVAPGPQSS